jgi:hypothetical protein
VRSDGRRVGGDRETERESGGGAAASWLGLWGY